MHKHIVVALATALSVTGLAAGPVHAVREIVVQPGETLQTISLQYYGDDDHAGEIARFNNLESPEQVYAGLHLLLPDVPDTGPRTGTGPQVRSSLASVLAPEPAATPTDPSASSGSPRGDPTARDATAPGGPARGQPIQSGLATWYGPGFQGGLTYCGDVYDQWSYTAASNTLPCGAVVVVTNQNTSASVSVRINDQGGFGGAVIMDLSRAAFAAIAPISAGVVPVVISTAPR
jgi:hypothetical protein